MTTEHSKRRIAIVILIGFWLLGRKLGWRGIPGSKTLTKIYVAIAHYVDNTFRWYRLPVPLGLATLGGLRVRLREKNLFNTYQGPHLRAAVVGLGTIYGRATARSVTDATKTGLPGSSYLTFRTADGTLNDLAEPLMGASGTRFGRNVPIRFTFPDQDNMMNPSPREISRQLLTRETFQAATSLNLLAGSWLQFMIRDWLSHGPGEKNNPWEIPVAKDDSWPEPAVRVPRTIGDPTRQASEASLPPTHVNTETHWWDGSQLYGSTEEDQQLVRSGTDGRLKWNDEMQIPPVQAGALDLPGFWIGLAMMHTLFTLEHNAICDRLKVEYPSWSDDDLFGRARLINAALMAKIHTVEWTPAIISHPTTKVALRANWWGLEMERLSRVAGRLSKSEVISGIPGSDTNQFGVPYSLTEEFVAVYKMHPLIPDDYTIRSASDDRVLRTCEFNDLAQSNTLPVIDSISMTDLFYSFGRMHPGAISLHNYPRALQVFHRPDGKYTDLASTDILRAREMGVPRYVRFRELLGLPPPRSFEALSHNREWVDQIRQAYDNHLDLVDLMIGLFAEDKPDGFGFSDTAFRIFILMASRRLNSDRFFTTDFTPAVYTPVGMQWIADNGMQSVLLRHFPDLAPAFRGVPNPFAPWQPAAAAGS